ncbi:MAG: ABC transporter permease, partial [Acidobacteria bacterium]|nr:ABC transporter permease [Acidobacteriota bacterium]
PFLGRNFTSEDIHIVPADMIYDPNAKFPTGAAIISYGFWQRRFGGARDALGKVFHIHGRPQELIGIMPPDFKAHLPSELSVAAESDAWVIPNWDQTLFPRDTRFLHVVGRLKPGVTIEQAQAEADAFARRQRDLFPVERDSGFRLKVEGLHNEVVKDASKSLLILFGAVCFLLLIACANIANLLIARATDREKELALRQALGASRGRLIRQLLSECLLLSSLGAAIGLLLSHWGIKLLMTLKPDNLPRLEEIGINGDVVGFTVVTTLITTLFFGIAPAIQSSRPNLSKALKEGGRATGGLARRRSQGLLVVLEVGLCFVLLIGAGLLLKSFALLHQVDPGFDPENVLTAKVSLPTSQYQNPEKRLSFFRQLEERIKNLPTVESVGLTSVLPLAGTSVSTITIGKPDSDEKQDYRVDLRKITPGYFQSIGTRLLSGRFPTWADVNNGNNLVVVVDEKLARRAWPGGSPLGKRMQVGILAFGGTDQVREETTSMEVIGVVENIRGASLSQDTLETAYVGYNIYTWGPTFLVVRTRGAHLSAAKEIRSLVYELDSNLPLSEIRSMESYLADSIAPLRFSLTLIGIFGIIGVALAAVGLYGVVSYSISQRTHEIGIRIAIGARPGDILRLVIASGMRLTLAGLCAGLAASFGLTRFLASQLFGVTPADPTTFIGVSCFLITIAFLACYLPARKAMLVETVEALRHE